MRFFESLAIGVAMYSKIPMPRVEWNEKNMKYAMCFFPLVGVVTGILEVILGNALLVYTSCGTLFFAGVMTLLPVLVNGGIHMDGFLDTMDALNSYGSRRKEAGNFKRLPHRSFRSDRIWTIPCGKSGIVE